MGKFGGGKRGGAESDRIVAVCQCCIVYSG